MELWNTKKTAEFLGITYSQFCRLLGKGQDHPPFKMVGSRRRFVRSEVERWVLDNQRPEHSA